jgi:hypothetical protein
VSQCIAFKVAQTAREEGIGRALSDEQLQAEIEAFCWFPDYASDVPGEKAPRPRPPGRAADET